MSDDAREHEWKTKGGTFYSATAGGGPLSDEIVRLAAREKALTAGVRLAVGRLSRPGEPHTYRDGLHASACPACSLLHGLRALLEES